jgi:hypothetical protein
MAGGKFDAPDQLQTRVSGYRNRGLITVESVMIGDGKRFQASCNSIADQFLRT